MSWKRYEIIKPVSIFSNKIFAEESHILVQLKTEKKIEKQISKLLDKKLIEESYSPCVIPLSVGGPGIQKG